MWLDFYTPLELDLTFSRKKQTLYGAKLFSGAIFGYAYEVQKLFLLPYLKLNFNFGGAYLLDKTKKNEVF